MITRVCAVRRGRVSDTGRGVAHPHIHIPRTPTIPVSTGTANFNQGWPKFAHAIFHTTADGAIAIGVLAPAKATLPAADGATTPATIEITTDYPFGDDATIGFSYKVHSVVAPFCAIFPA